MGVFDHVAAHISVTIDAVLLRGDVLNSELDELDRALDILVENKKIQNKHETVYKIATIRQTLGNMRYALSSMTDSLKVSNEALQSDLSNA